MRPTRRGTPHPDNRNDLSRSVSTVADITLINLNMLFLRYGDQIDRERHVPLGPLYLTRALEDEGFKVDFRDYQTHEGPDPFRLETFLDFARDPAPIIGLSCMANLLPFTVLALKALRERYPNRKLVLGGVGSNAVEDQLLARFPWIDVICRGEGERTGPELLTALKDGGNLSCVQGISYRRDGQVQHNPARPRIRHLDSIPLPAFEKIDLSRYAGYGMMTSRGCPYTCSYCDRSVYGRSFRFNSAEYVYEHMRYLAAFCGGPNNWYQVEASGLAVAAMYSPELLHSDAYLRLALRRLKWINSFAYYDDGFQFELSHGYHMFPTNAIFSVVQMSRARGVELPRDFVELVEKAHEMYLFAVQPNHLLPMFNDCGAQPIDPSPTLLSAAEVFNRDDLRWGGAYGKQGRAPDHASHAWSAAGYYVMRDKWGEDGQFLFFDGAAWGASHQHEDKLSFTLYSHGRLLIGDPNIYSYAPTALTHYFKSSRGHNLVMVDGRGQARRFRRGDL